MLKSTSRRARHSSLHLADSGRLDEAWTECLALAEAVSAEVDDQLMGKVYWVIGNVAFLCSRVEKDCSIHELAAATFSPARNLDVWAKFNNARGHAARGRYCGRRHLALY